MSYGGSNPHHHHNRPSWPPGGGPYPPPPPYPPSAAPDPYVPGQSGPPGYGPYVPYPPYLYAPPQPNRSVWQRLRDDEWPSLGEVLRGRRQRIHGCVWALLLFPCHWLLTLCFVVFYPTARSAHGWARRLFPEPDHRRIEDPGMMRLQRVRAWAGVVASFVMLSAFGRAEDVAKAYFQLMTRLAVTPWLLLLSAPLVVAVLCRRASIEARADIRPRLRAAVRPALQYFGAFTLVPLLGMAAVAVVHHYVSTVDGLTLVLYAYLLVLPLAPVLWLLVFVVFSSGPAIRSFDTAEVHRALPALLTGVLVWEAAVLGWATGGLPPGPPLAQVCMLLGGPVSVTALAWWEIHRLRTRHGVRLPARHPAPPAY